MSQETFVIGGYSVDLEVGKDGQLCISVDRIDDVKTFVHTIDINIPKDLNPHNVKIG